jgi:membrane protein required for colicin V production
MTAFDWIAVGLLTASAILGLMRGASRQIASIVGFIIAIALAVAVGAPLGHAFEGMLHPPWLARGAAMTLVFVAVYFAVTLVGAMITRGLRSVGLSGVDRVLGLGLGLTRGLVVLGAVFLALSAIAPNDHMPSWIGRARLWPLASGAGKALQAVAPSGLGLGREMQRRVGQTLAQDGDEPDRVRGADKLQVVEDRR